MTKTLKGGNVEKEKKKNEGYKRNGKKDNKKNGNKMKDELQKIYDKLNKIPEAERKEISHKFKQAGSLMREARLDYGLTLKELCLLISDNSITP